MDAPTTTPDARLAAAAVAVAGVCASQGLPDVVARLGDDELVALLADASAARDASDLIIAGVSAEVARRSSRELGYAGLAQRRGYRNVTSLVQSITGQSRADVGRALRVGEDVVPVVPVASVEPSRSSTPVGVEWLGMLRDALGSGLLSSAQFQAIRTGLGEPPVERYPDLDPGFLPAAWAQAVEILLCEAAVSPVEELRNAARIARDRLDPVGVTLRFEERFAARSFRTWVDEQGQHHARIVFDDEAAAWVHAMLGAALRPRRGPRFVAASGPRPGDGGEPAEAGTVAADAAAVVAAVGADERSNEQLQYDTLIAVLRTGANADPGQAFGDRQPGVRVIVDASAITGADQRGGMRVTGVGHVEDGGAALPGGVVEKLLCDAGSIQVDIDSFGRPLDVGREKRLFTIAQRIAIGIRVGGCFWPACIAPISECEFHHDDHWWEDHGRTDVDDGVPLCRNCHLRLHNQGWKITRTRDAETGLDTYWLHPPIDPETGLRGEPVALATKSPRRFQAA